MKTRCIIIVLFVTVLFSEKSTAQDQNWVKNNTWYFDNFVKDILPWSLFRETFIGVAPAPSADFDFIFYEALYKNQLAAKGHCYGMDVMAMLMLKNGGHLGYCHPPYMYSGSFVSNSAADGMPSNDTIGPSDQNLKTAIGMTHGNQINHGFLSFLLDVIAITKSRDGRYTCLQVDYYLAKNDPPVISITKGLSPADGGHVLIPFFVKPVGLGKRIYVYDPNRSYYEPGLDGKQFYTMDSNYIEVTNTGAWKYNMGSSASPSYWNGSPGSGGHCIAIPLSIAGKKDRLPQSLLAEGAYAINTIFISGDVKVEQIADPSGKRQYLSDDGTELEPCEEKRMNNILLFIPLSGNLPSKGTGKQTTYFFRGTDPVDLRYRARGKYKIGIIFHGKYVEVKGDGKGELQHFPLEKLVKE
jgi:hypothetical protein